jgi:hypothetical protein
MLLCDQTATPVLLFVHIYIVFETVFIHIEPIEYPIVLSLLPVGATVAERLFRTALLKAINTRESVPTTAGEIRQLKFRFWLTVPLLT